MLLVVGTGISIGATGDTRASWPGLLLDAVNRQAVLGISDPETLEAERVLIRKAFASEFDLDEILQRAESIIKRFGGADDQRFADWLQESVGSLEAQADRRESLDAIADLAKAGTLIMTTNYDDLLCDATGLDPITWEEPSKILEILNRQRKGIIHIHGHWSRPSSVVLGRTSYERVKAAALTQIELKSLWLHWHWFYLGCGSGGLDDPNVGALLQWAHEAGFEESALSDYFVSTGETINLLPDRLRKSTRLVVYSYPDHAIDLPPLLRALTPKARAAPFQLLGPDARRVRRESESPMQSPFPSWAEYLGGAVPKLAADEEVCQRLRDHGWAFVLDVASVGKSTLAFRIATRPEHKENLAYYLLLSQAVLDEPDNDASPQAALARLARPGVLFVIDDCHQHPELAHTLWQQWREHANGSLLILLATRMEKSVRLAGDSSLQDLEVHSGNPAVMLLPSPEDLGSIANYVIARAEDFDGTVLMPSREVLSTWHRTFGREIGAFVVAISQRRRELKRGDFTLPDSAGALWMRERYLDKLDERDLENALCLAVFGAQQLEIDVPEDSLPHPKRIDRLLKSHLVTRVDVGKGSLRYGLREPGWGTLIVAAVESPPYWLPTVTEAVIKDLSLALSVSSRLQRSGRPEEQHQFWQQLALTVGQQADRFAERAVALPLQHLTDFQVEARKHERENLSDGLWQGLAARLGQLAGRAFEAPLGVTVRFLSIARQHGQNDLASALERRLAANPTLIAERAFDTTLNWCAAFLNTALRSGQQDLVDGIWSALAKQPDRLIAKAFTAPLNSVATFLDVAQQQGQQGLTDRLWRSLAERSDQLLDRALRGTLNDVAAFMDIAGKRDQEPLIALLSDLLSTKPEQLLSQALASTLNDMAAFLDVVGKRGQEKLVAALCDRLAAQPDKLLERALASSLNDLATFLKVAADQGQSALVESLCEALTKHSEALADMALTGPLHHLSALVTTVGKQGQVKLSERIWSALAAQPDRLAAHAAQQRPLYLMGFLSSAPADLREQLIRRLKVEDWAYGPYRSQRFSTGALGLANQFALNGREDLSLALVDNILRRKNPQDFSYPKNALSEMSRLLSLTAPNQVVALSELLRTICTERWLARAYRSESTIGLAGALHRIALFHPPSTIRLFWSHALGSRLDRDFLNLVSRDDQALNAALQLLGSAQLVGWQTNRSLLLNAPLDRIGRLPETIGHREEAEIVEQWQRQFWMGLRAIASLVRKPLRVDSTLIVKTRDLWQRNIEGGGSWTGSKHAPDSTAHQINLSMTKWLEACARTKSGLLLPNNEPLWMLAGFLRNPDAI